MFLVGATAKLVSDGDLQKAELIAVGLALLALALIVLNTIATFKIITKAGYSGWWLLLPLSPLAVYLITNAVLYRAADSPFSSASANFDWSSVLALFIADGALTLLSWVFFLVFAFSDWPVHRQLRDHRRRLAMMERSAAGEGSRLDDGRVESVFRSGATASIAAVPSVPVTSPASLPSSVAPNGSTTGASVPAAFPSSVSGPPPDVTDVGPGVTAPRSVVGPLCPTCSTENRASSAFCRQCGTRLPRSRTLRHNAYDERT